MSSLGVSTPTPIAAPGDGEPVERIDDIEVTTRIVDLLNGSQTLGLLLYVEPSPITVTLPRSEVNRNIIPKLAKYGLSLTDTAENAELVQTQIFDTEKSAEVRYQHSALGFHDLDGDRVFLAHHPIGLPEDDVCAGSTFAKPTITEPVGTLEGWKAFVQHEVLGHPNLELALMIGLSAPVAYLLREQNAFAEIPLWALVGRSSTGKTTALRLMASAFGSPVEGSGLIRDMNCTENAFFAFLSDNSGVPLIIDEATEVSWNFSRTVYNLAKGKDRARCASDGSLKDQRSFSGTLVFSSEASILKPGAPLGAHARLMELELPWIDDAAHGRVVNAGVFENYGHAVEPFVGYILWREKVQSGTLKANFAAEVERLLPSIGTDGADVRACNIIATIMITCGLARFTLGLNFDYAAIEALLIGQYRHNAKETDPAESAYWAIMSSVSEHGSKFSVRSDKACPFATDCVGQYESRNGKRCVWIVGDIMAKYAAEKDFDNFKQHLSTWYERGYIEQFSGGRFLTTHNIADHVQKCYCLYLQVTADPAAPKKRTPLSSIRHSILDDEDDD